MAVHSLTICHWLAAQRRDEVILDPSWLAVETAIRNLDNSERNDIYLHPLRGVDEVYLAVGGGAGKYLVTGTDAASRFPTLGNSAASENQFVLLVVGGQPGEYPTRYVVELDAALAAARSFYDAGGFECGIDWDYW